MPLRANRGGAFHRTLGDDLTVQACCSYCSHIIKKRRKNGTPPACLPSAFLDNKKPCRVAGFLKNPFGLFFHFYTAERPV